MSENIPAPHFQTDAELIKRLDAEVTRLRNELDRAYREARGLAFSIYRSEYSRTAPQWNPLEDTAGVISQIDNMYAGIRDQRDTLRAAISLEIRENMTLKKGATLFQFEHFTVKQHSRLLRILDPQPPATTG